MCELVKLSINPKFGKTTWQIVTSNTGVGEIEQMGDYMCIFTAPIFPDEITIEAQPSHPGCTQKIQKTFTIIKPDSVTFSKACGIHQKDINNVGLKTFLYFFPDDVSFEKISFAEDEVNAKASGALSMLNGVPHGANPVYAPAKDLVVKGLGTLIVTIDCAYWNIKKFPEPTDDKGERTFSIENQYQKTGSGNTWGIYFHTSIQKGTFERKQKDSGSEKKYNYLIESKGTAESGYWKSDDTAVCEQCAF